jgi:hypothetical protein
LDNTCRWIRIKRLGIHSKSIVLQWSIIRFPFINWNRWCFKIVKVFFVTMYLWQVQTNQRQNIRLISIWCSSYVNWGVLHSRLLRAKYFAEKCFVEVFIYLGQRDRNLKYFLGSPNNRTFLNFNTFSVESKRLMQIDNFYFKMFLVMFGNYW